MKWGVDTVFGLPADGINGIMEALRQRREKIRFIQVRHEEAAPFMACAYRKFSGKLGACLDSTKSERLRNALMAVLASTRFLSYAGPISIA